MKKGMALLFIPLLLTGCSANAQGDGFFHQLVVSPLTHLMEFSAQLFNGNYGLSIILATLMIRLLLFPLMAKQQKSMDAINKFVDEKIVQTHIIIDPIFKDCPFERSELSNKIRK